MPIPNPRQGENKDDYIVRCMADSTMIAEYPENKQRVSVCNSNFEKVEFAKHEVKEAEIFAVGKWNGFNFTVKDLEGIASAFNKLSEFHKVPLKLGHNKKQPITDGQPSLGWVDGVWVSGKKLMAHFVDVPKILIEAMDKRLYRTVSIELDRDVSFKGMKFNNVLSAVALLGADIPAVGNLADLKTLMSREGYASSGQLSFSAINGNLNEDTGMTPEEIAAMKAKMAKLEAEKATAEADAITFKAKAKIAEAETAEFKATEEKRVEKESKAKVEFARKTVTDMLEQAVKDEQITPAKRDMFSRMLKVDDDSIVDVKLDDVKELIGEGKEMKFIKDKSKQGDGKDKSDYTSPGDELNSRALVYAAENKVGFTKAMDIEMIKDPKLAQEYIDEPTLLDVG